MTCFEIVMSILTAIYVGTTIFYAVTSHRTLRAIESQGKSSTEQFTQQITEAKKSADAAERAAKALINSEAASVVASIRWAQNRSNVFTSTGTGGDRTAIYVDYGCINQGRTAAWITEKRFGFAIVDAIPDEPDLDSIGCIQPDPDPVDAHGDSWFPNYNWEAMGHIVPGKTALIWGVVRYEDVFGGRRESRFGYKIAHNRNLQRLWLPAYNKRT